MFNLFRKEKIEDTKEKPLLIEVNIPEFTEAEKDFIKSFIKNIHFKKVQKYLISCLMNKMMIYEVEEAFKSGWIECVRTLRDLPVDPPDKDISEDKESVYTDEL